MNAAEANDQKADQMFLFYFFAGGYHQDKGGRRMSAHGTSATFTRRGSMSGSESFSDISAWPAYFAD
jgi:hypothetical protein